MYLVPKDLVIKTIVDWIDTSELDLQPDFQRDEVWSRKKKQLLVDTILREWQMPPIFVVVDKQSKRKDVLDGQQRLKSVHDFYLNKIPVDGTLQPFSPALSNIDGKYFKELPVDIQRSFMNFPIRFFEIVDYEQEEPFELFYRLNQSVVLTSAERRNTFFGDVRNQIQNLVGHMEEVGLHKDSLGFSNFRLAYHDVLVRFCFYMEKKNLDKKVTDNMLVERYRNKSSFSRNIISKAEECLSILSSVVNTSPVRIKFSKPTLLSWLMFIATIDCSNDLSHRLDMFFYNFEFTKNKNIEYENGNIVHAFESNISLELVNEFKYRSSTSVNDAVSVKIRHFVLCYLWWTVGGNFVSEEIIERIEQSKDDLFNGECSLGEALDVNWGRYEVC